MALFSVLTKGTVMKLVVACLVICFVLPAKAYVLGGAIRDQIGEFSSADDGAGADTGDSEPRGRGRRGRRRG